jgi:hypothetical protein
MASARFLPLDLLTLSQPLYRLGCLGRVIAPDDILRFVLDDDPVPAKRADPFRRVHRQAAAQDKGAEIPSGCADGEVTVTGALGANFVNAALQRIHKAIA